jgi:hypothetical protein
VAEAGAAVIVKAVDGVTVNGDDVVALPPEVMTEMGPVAAPAGTTNESEAAELVETGGLIEPPPNCDITICGAAPKFDPATLTSVPAGPFLGLKPVTVVDVPSAAQYGSSTASITIWTSTTSTEPLPFKSLAAAATPRAWLISFCTSATVVTPSWFTSHLLKVVAWLHAIANPQKQNRRATRLAIIEAYPPAAHAPSVIVEDYTR